MKKSSIKVYDAKQGAPKKGKIWCCVSQEYYDMANVRAAHIVPHALGPELVGYISGSGSGSRLDSSDNYLLLHREVETGLDKGNFVLLPVDAGEVPILRWKVQMTNMSAIHSDMEKKILRALDGKEISFKNDNRPASRFLYYHFVVTLLRNERDRQPGCELVDAHKCLCEGCKPEYHEALRSTMVEEGKAIWMAEVTKETLEVLKRDLITEYKEEFNSKASKQAREECEVEMFKRIEKLYKEKLMREITEEWKAAETEKVKVAVRQEYEAKFRSFLG
ncbi:MAG: hypothetical protein Q9161_001045 [Pseudevernia consocians]